ncbi:MAG: peptidylprolyl isomerase, partial [Caulobacteraceae bacterium]|nr:peptidylprolyl isomerase [Caulobacteraceae bacterium]
GTGTSGSKKPNLKAEFSKEPHVRGVCSMARTAVPDSANSQFFLMRQTYPSLNSQYTVWGRVISGLDVVRRIKAGPDDSTVVPPQDTMTRVRLLADIPAVEQPKIQVMDTRSPGFKALVEAEKAKAGGVLTACDVEIPVRVN